MLSLELTKLSPLGNDTYHGFPLAHATMARLGYIADMSIVILFGAVHIFVNMFILTLNAKNE